MLSIDERAGSLVSALEWLDELLAAAVDAADRVFGTPDPFRGLHINRAEVTRLLARDRGIPLLSGRSPSRSVALTDLEDLLGLDAFDMDVVLLALAPELDLAY